MRLIPRLLAHLRNLPDDFWQATLAVVTTSSVSDFLDIGLAFSLQMPPVPELVAA